MGRHMTPSGKLALEEVAGLALGREAEERAVLSLVTLPCAHRGAPATQRSGKETAAVHRHEEMLIDKMVIRYWLLLNVS